jgi:hypothetical protein
MGSRLQMCEVMCEVMCEDLVVVPVGGVCVYGEGFRWRLS